LLAALPWDDYARLASALEPCRLRAQQVLAFPGEPVRFIYFPRNAVVSLLVPMENGSTIEAAAIGNEGLVGVQGFLGNGSATEECVVQIPGNADRIAAPRFQEAVGSSVLLQRVLHRYVLVVMGQIARTAACNHLHPVGARCARWMLMSGDRAGTDTFPLTHDSLAILLGVRRASVTNAMIALQKAGVIAYRRGRVSIRDRGRLVAAGCEDYRLISEAYDSLRRDDDW
jgi:CRP-like cAMP-binding protein